MRLVINEIYSTWPAACKCWPNRAAVTDHTSKLVLFLCLWTVRAVLSLWNQTKWYAEVLPGAVFCIWKRANHYLFVLNYYPASHLWLRFVLYSLTISSLASTRSNTIFTLRSSHGKISASRQMVFERHTYNDVNCCNDGDWLSGVFQSNIKNTIRCKLHTRNLLPIVSLWSNIFVRASTWIHLHRECIKQWFYHTGKHKHSILNCFVGNFTCAILVHVV